MSPARQSELKVPELTVLRLPTAAQPAFAVAIARHGAEGVMVRDPIPEDGASLLVLQANGIAVLPVRIWRPVWGGGIGGAVVDTRGARREPTLSRSLPVYRA